MTSLAEAVEPPARRHLQTLPAEETSQTTLYTIIETENPFRDQWYPVSPVADLPRDRPYGIELFNTPLVVFFDTKADTWRCLLDRCKHRAVSLSCGKLKDGTVECLYHGWTYDGEGRCVHIPSVRSFRPQEKLKVDHFAVRVYARILWVYAGRPEAADASRLPELPWDDPSYYACLFVRDTEFDWLIYNEHNLDREHLGFAHPKTLGHMPPARGLPARVDSDRQASGMFYRQPVGTEEAPDTSEIVFHPPSTTFADSHAGGKTVGICFTVSPLGYGRCRVIFLLYASKKLPVPDFMFHLTFARVTEEDAVLIRSQMTQLASGNLAADELFVNVGQDLLARDYRAWLRAEGGDFWQRQLNRHVGGERAPQARTLAPESASLYRKWEGQMHLADRYRQHFTICRTCQRAHRRFVFGRALFFALAGGVVLVGLRGNALTVALELLAIAVSMALALVADHFVRLLEGKRF